MINTEPGTDTSLLCGKKKNTSIIWGTNFSWSLNVSHNFVCGCPHYYYWDYCLCCTWLLPITHIHPHLYTLSVHWDSHPCACKCSQKHTHTHTQTPITHTYNILPGLESICGPAQSPLHKLFVINERAWGLLLRWSSKKTQLRQLVPMEAKTALLPYALVLLHFYHSQLHSQNALFYLPSDFISCIHTHTLTHTHAHTHTDCNWIKGLMCTGLSCRVRHPPLLCRLT